MRLDLVGPTNRMASVAFDPERSVNWFEETITPPGVGTAAQKGLRYTAGVQIAYTFGDGPNYAEFTQDGRAFAINGSAFAEVFSDGTQTEYGMVAVDADYRATICSNGSAGDQLFITAGGYGYIFTLSTNAFAAIADVDFPNGTALMGEFMDGYFLVQVANTRRFQISALEDGTSWDGLDVAERSEGSDNIAFLKRNHREIWLVGTRTGEVWYDNGDVDFPFAPIQGVFLERGCVASFSASRTAETLAWLDQDERGGGVVVLADGYRPEQISTYAINRQIADQSTTLSQAVAFTMQEQGHLFYWLDLPNSDTTPVFDLTERSWHERALWDTTSGSWQRHVAWTHMYAFGKHFVGDRRTFVIYEINPSFYENEIAVP